MSKMPVKTVLLSAVLMALSPLTNAETAITVNVNVEHAVGGISEFDRKKYITMHSNIRDQDWNGEEDKLRYLLEDLDVYFGRDNGGINWYMQQADEDPSRPGYADPAWMQSQGAYVRNTVYGQNESAQHDLDARNDVMIGGQAHVFWHGASTHPCCGGSSWDIQGPEAMGEFMGRFLNEFYRDDNQSPTQGAKRPTYLEVLNEPLYELVDTGTETTLAVFEFHNDIAQAVRAQNSDVMIGGYTTAFPYFDERGFDRWHERMKLFIDTSGEHMDFFSIHLYDFETLYQSDTFDYQGPFNFKGSRISATLDMMEQYSYLTLGEIKPYIISEYGGRDHELEAAEWSPLRDWHFVKAFTPMMMQFMERPDVMLKTIPFTLVKASWADEIYDWRLLRQANELEGETGEEWVFTEFVKFYELWSDVNGTRVDTLSTNPDVLVDAYVDGDKVYVVVSNLVKDPQTLDLSLFGAMDAEVESVSVKHLHLQGDAPVLATSQAESLAQFELASEASAIITFDFDSNLTINEQSNETKYYADSYLKEIQANQALTFNINEVQKSEFGEAYLRLSMGREHGLSLTPTVSINGTPVTIATDFSGDDQNKRDQFFGSLDIPVPYALLQQNNQISVTFADNGGHVSSATLAVFSFSSDLRASEDTLAPPVVSASNQSLSSSTFSSGDGEQIVMKFSIQADTNGAELHSLNVVSSGEIDETSDLSFVRLYQDVNGDESLVTFVQSAYYSQDNGEIQFMLNQPITLNAGENIFHITYDF
ncbi:beta-agarase [Alteromonas sp. KUL49]|uniref:beta-agarase n=1 Tax=Alteromonas sp. KUL49 TaxID=2480798 RepID=UPI0010FFC619|nr:beta-agarase [Alteromonas sp. KUL49]GEA11224.1 hypothetical protein KUL49_15990 [Alteromonas sp. KUL49]